MDATTRDIPLVSLCEGPIVFPRELRQAAGSTRASSRRHMVGLNHGGWTRDATYDGAT